MIKLKRTQKTLSISVLTIILLTSSMFIIVNACRDPWGTDDPDGGMYDFFKDWRKFFKDKWGGDDCTPKPPCFVIPEIPIGTLGTILAMIGAIAIFVTRSRPLTFIQA